MSFRSRPSTASLAWPYLMGIVVLVAIPAVGTLYLAFTEYFGIEAPNLVGIDNFTRMLGSDRFWTALGNSTIYVLIAVPLPRRCRGRARSPLTHSVDRVRRSADHRLPPDDSSRRRVRASVALHLQSIVRPPDPRSRSGWDLVSGVAG